MEKSPLKPAPDGPKGAGMRKLLAVVETLRGKNGCPWDQKQTPRTLSVYLVEEVYELVDAIAADNPAAVCEELGDVLFQLVFVARLFEEQGHFAFGDVVDANIRKMIRRHPHVYGSDKLETSDQVREKWHAIKAVERQNGPPASVLDSVPEKLPALMRAYRISERAARTGFDWDDLEGVMDKVEEEWAEFKAALKAGFASAAAEAAENRNVALEFGDLMFTLTNVARFARIHPETSLSDAIHKFVKRFQYMEHVLQKRGECIDNASRAEMDRLWGAAKQALGDGGPEAGGPSDRESVP